MDYEAAMVICREDGKRVTHPGMGKGWTVFWSNRVADYFCLNPHTGSDYLFTATPEERSRTDWRAV